MVYGFHVSAFLQSGIYMYSQTVALHDHKLNIKGKKCVKLYQTIIISDIIFCIWLEKNRERADLILCQWKGLSYWNSFLVFHSEKQLFSIRYIHSGKFLAVLMYKFQNHLPTNCEGFSLLTVKDTHDCSTRLSFGMTYALPKSRTNYWIFNIWY